MDTLEYIQSVVGKLDFGNPRQIKILKKIEIYGIAYVAHLIYQHRIKGQTVLPESFESRLQKMDEWDAVRWPKGKRRSPEETEEGKAVRATFTEG